jgi:hypothetical protein
MGQVSFPIVLLFSFRELKRRVAFRTRDLQIWHGGFSKRVCEVPLSFLRSAGVAFLPTRCVFQSALVIKHYAEKHTRPDTFDGPSLLHRDIYSNL